MLAENAQELINTISKLKPSSAKGTYFRSVNLSSTMSPGLSIDKSTVAGI
jgi:large subunit ribosomal protein L1